MNNFWGTFRIRRPTFWCTFLQTLLIWAPLYLSPKFPRSPPLFKLLGGNTSAECYLLLNRTCLSNPPPYNPSFVATWASNFFLSQTVKNLEWWSFISEAIRGGQDSLSPFINVNLRGTSLGTDENSFQLLLLKYLLLFLVIVCYFNFHIKKITLWITTSILIFKES